MQSHKPVQTILLKLRDTTKLKGALSLKERSNGLRHVASPNSLLRTLDLYFPTHEPTKDDQEQGSLDAIDGN